MKKFLVIFLGAIVIGVFLGKFIFDQYKKKDIDVFNEAKKIYIFQQGVYSSEASVKNNTSKLKFYITIKDGEYYRVYVAVTKNKDYVDKIKEAYVKAGNDIYVRELTTNNIAFLDLLDQYDKLIEISNKGDDIMEIEKQVISKYKEIIIGDNNS